ncbi:hypothetical protein H0H81_010657 [Sphagnurus paluster]|uniref:Uncharacterized protein n=1 Tax=Sphagnurus paluster TaxID=117069 RepID=A0A9P7FP65_9AGAR|nr:hypothetical protein H0H81_010657 [Sphagnurus paluster]
MSPSPSHPTSKRRNSSADDDDARPSKRPRHGPPQPASSSPPPASSPGPHDLQRLPPATLLLALPNMLLHPRTHPRHAQSLDLARHALRQCLKLSALEPREECRAWTGLVELGIMWLDAGLEGAGEVLVEVETALTKAIYDVLTSAQHPALQLYTPHLQTLSARLAQAHQANHKLAALTLRRQLASLPRSAPPHVRFGAHLSLVHSYWADADSEAESPSTTTTTPGAESPAFRRCLTALDVMHAAAVSRAQAAFAGAPSAYTPTSSDRDPRTTPLVILPLILRVQLLVRHARWARVPDALAEAEEAVRVFDAFHAGEGSGSGDVGQAASISASTTPTMITATASSSSLSSSSTSAATTAPAPAAGGSPPPSPLLPPALRVHLLVLGVLVHTYAGDAANAGERLKVLHAFLDEGVLEFRDQAGGGGDGDGDEDGCRWRREREREFYEGIVEIPFSFHFPAANPTNTNTTTTTTPPLRIHGTPPRVLHALAFLLSAVAKRDAVGRAPKKGVFARAGLALAELQLPLPLPLPDPIRIAHHGDEAEGGGEREGEGAEERDRVGVGVADGLYAKTMGSMYALGRSAREVQRERRRMGRVRADLLAEVVAINTMRSEHAAAQQTLDELVAHTRTCGVFPAYAARVALLAAQLAHARGDVRGAVRAYRVAGWVAGGGGRGKDGVAGGGKAKGKGKGGEVKQEEDVVGQGRGEWDGCAADEWVRVAARAGEVWVRVGVVRMRQRERQSQRQRAGTTAGLGLELGSRSGSGSASGLSDLSSLSALTESTLASPDPGREDACTEPDADADIGADKEAEDDEDEEELRVLRRMGAEVVRECEGLGGTLVAVAEVVRACLAEEVLGAKKHLRHALDLATRAQDNHLRALVLALVAAHYQHTAREHALAVLGTCAQLAAGLGAPAKGSSASAGGAPGNAKEGKGKDAAGNVQLRLWVGERVVELHRWAGQEGLAARQEVVNQRLREVIAVREG